MKNYVTFNGMTWPDGERIAEIEYALRYAPTTLTRNDKLYVASVLAAYRSLVEQGDPKAITDQIKRQR